MFGSLGFPELVLIFVIALIVFGPRKLPEIGRQVGKAMGEFKKATNEVRMTLEEEVRAVEAQTRIEEPKTATASSPDVGAAAATPTTDNPVITPAANTVAAGSASDIQAS